MFDLFTLVYTLIYFVLGDPLMLTVGRFYWVRRRRLGDDNEQPIQLPERTSHREPCGPTMSLKIAFPVSSSCAKSSELLPRSRQSRPPTFSGGTSHNTPDTEHGGSSANDDADKSWLSRLTSPENMLAHAPFKGEQSNSTSSSNTMGIPVWSSENEASVIVAHTTDVCADDAFKDLGIYPQRNSRANDADVVEKHDVESYLAISLTRRPSFPHEQWSEIELEQSLQKLARPPSFGCDLVSTSHVTLLNDMSRWRSSSQSSSLHEYFRPPKNMD